MQIKFWEKECFLVVVLLILPTSTPQLEAGEAHCSLHFIRACLQVHPY